MQRYKVEVVVESVPHVFYVYADNEDDASAQAGELFMDAEDVRDDWEITSVEEIDDGTY